MGILKEMSMLNGIPGNEKQVRAYMNNKMKDISEVSFDNLGSIIAKKVGNPDGPRIMVAGHMDEVGFMVTTITEEGYVKFTPAGGWWSQVMLAQQMVITTCDNKEIRGVIGAKAPHILTVEERAKPVAMDKMYLDLGVENKEEATKLGIKPGDMITPYIEAIKLSNKKYLLGKAWDNRVGCAAAIEVLQNIQGEKHENIYFGVGTVQEEVGLRGAKTSSHKFKWSNNCQYIKYHQRNINQLRNYLKCYLGWRWHHQRLHRLINRMEPRLRLGRPRCCRLRRRIRPAQPPV